MAKKDKDPVTVVAELEIWCPDFSEKVRSFDKAWHRLLECPTPAYSRLIGFVRKTDKELTEE